MIQQLRLNLQRGLPHRHSAVLRGAFLLTFFALLVPTAVAQNDTSRLEGKVTDTSGAVVPNVTVNVVSKGTGQQLQATSSADGTFTISALPVGDYQITAQAQGFKTYTQDLRVDAGIVASASISLQPGAVTETVTVTEQAGLVQATSSSIATTIQGKQVTDLPINGRNFTQLATLVPGVTRGNPNGIETGTQGNAETFRYGNTGGASLVVNGLSRRRTTSFLMGRITMRAWSTQSFSFRRRMQFRNSRCRPTLLRPSSGARVARL